MTASANIYGNTVRQAFLGKINWTGDVIQTCTLNNFETTRTFLSCTSCCGIHGR